MRGVGWDDLGREIGGLVRERKLYEDLRAALLERQIDYGWQENPDSFLKEALTQQVGFATIDLIGGQDEDAGRRISRDLRASRRDQGDPDFPIFLLTSSPGRYSHEEAYRDRIVVIEKKSPELIAERIRAELRASGRFGNLNHVLVFARHAQESLSGSALQDLHLKRLREMLTDLGKEVIEVGRDVYSPNIIDTLRLQIQDAGKIVVLATADETLAGSKKSTLPRPNVLVELGLVLGVRGGDRKLIFVCEKCVHVPSNLRQIPPIPFEQSLDEANEKIRLALNRPL